MPPKNHKLGFEKIRTIFYFGILGLLSIGFFYIIIPFIYPIFWAAIIAVFFYPFYAWINKNLKLPNISATISVITVVTVLFIPLSIIAALIVYQSADLYNTVSQNNFFTNVDNVTNRLDNSILAPYLETIKTEWTAYATNATKAISSFLVASITKITQNSLRFAFMVFIMLYTLYYFLKDGKKILERLMHLSPLGDNYEKLLFHRFTSTARATLKSTLIVGGIQGTLGGIMFLIAGVQGAFIWGVIMVILSIIPAVGSFLVWFPAGIIMFALGNIWQGVFIILFGSIVIGMIDNLLRPPLIGKDIQMHPLIVLFSTLGGLAIFGISGFVIGPIIAALFLSVLSIYDHYYSKELSNN